MVSLYTESVEQLEADVFDAVRVIVGPKQHEDLPGVGHQRVGWSLTTAKPTRTQTDTDRYTDTYRDHTYTCHM